MPGELDHRGAVIKRVVIKHYRGIKLFEWLPSAGMNVLIGPSDTCKSTILSAISLLLSPSQNTVITEFDFYNRDRSSEIVIEAVISLDDLSCLSEGGFPAPPLQGWKNSALHALPDEDDAEPVIFCRLFVSKDFETERCIVGAGGQTYSFRRSLRQRIGLMRLGFADKYDRDLRLVQGGALDQYIGSRDVRDSILRTLFTTSIHDALEQDVKVKLEEVESRFKQEALPSPVRLGLIGTPGVSMAASVGLMAGENNENALPLTSWGAGTQKFASLAMTSLVSENHAIALIDELEAGLEPYRQRSFTKKVSSEGRRQSFIVTHSAAVLETVASLNGAVWRLISVADESSVPNFSHQSIKLNEDAAMTKILQKNPEALLARLSIICEGKTELGFTEVLLERKFGSDYHSRGIYPFEIGNGNDGALKACQKFIEAKLPFACVADDEGTNSGGWQTVSQSSSCLRWDNQKCTEMIVFDLVPENRLLEILDWAESIDYREKRHLIPEIRKSLGENALESETTWLSVFGKEALLAAIIKVAVPPNSRGKGWFKSVSGGRCLAEKMLELGPSLPLQKKLDSFLGFVEQATKHDHRA